MPGVMVVRLSLSLEEAKRRATTRIAYLTDPQYEQLHLRQQQP